jgi:hypothetical protein
VSWRAKETPRFPFRLLPADDNDNHKPEAIRTAQTVLTECGVLLRDASNKLEESNFSYSATLQTYPRLLNAVRAEGTSNTDGDTARGRALHERLKHLQRIQRLVWWAVKHEWLACVERMNKRNHMLWQSSSSNTPTTEEHASVHNELFTHMRELLRSCAIDDAKAERISSLYRAPAHLQPGLHAQYNAIQLAVAGKITEDGNDTLGTGGMRRAAPRQWAEEHGGEARRVRKTFLLRKKTHTHTQCEAKKKSGAMQCTC